MTQAMNALKCAAFNRPLQHHLWNNEKRTLSRRIHNGNKDVSDIVIIGGSVVGCSIAYFIASKLGKAAASRVKVIERDPLHRFCSTTLSAGSIRHQFSTKANIEMSLFGTHFLRNIGDYLSVEGEAPEIGFKEAGYLFLATETGLPILEHNVKLQQENGAEVRLMTPPEISNKFPWMNVSDIQGGSLGVDGEGWFDPYGVLMGFKNKAKELGVQFVTDTVEALEMGKGGNHVEGVHLASGSILPCGQVINASGPAARYIAEMAGVSIPVFARKRCIYVFNCRSKDELTNCPMVVDPSGVYFRPESGHFICGFSPKDEEEDPNVMSDDFEVHHDVFDHYLWPALAARVPVFEAVKVVNAWAGHYACNTFDHNAILGLSPTIDNMYFACGFSGHGLQHAPAVGRAISELLINGKYTSLDVSCFGFERLLSGKPVMELNVL